MENKTLIPEPISKDVYEKYYQIIERKHIEIDKNYHGDYSKILIEDLDLLGRIINAIERSVQDITSEENLKGRKEISENVVELLNSWVLILSSWNEDETNLIAALNYNFLPAISILKNYSSKDFSNTIRHLSKLNSGIKDSEFVKSISSEYLISSFSSFSSSLDSKNDEMQQYLFDYLMQKVKSKYGVNYDYRRIDPNNLSYSMKTNILKLAVNIEQHYDNDLFDLKKILKELKKIENVEDLREQVSKIDFFNPLEKLYFFDDDTQNVIWEIKIKISNHEDKYNAAEIGYLIWSIAKALESIDDIEVELTEWGDGSKWFNMRIKIKSIASKVDLSQVLKQSLRAVEVFYTKKPLEEIDKYESEKNNLDAQTEKIKKETILMHEDGDAELLNKLDIHGKILDIQKKEVEIEDKKADVRLKNAMYLKQLSELMTNGIIQNNSDIQILINDALYFNKHKNQTDYGNADLLDVNEKVVSKVEENFTDEDNFESI